MKDVLIGVICKLEKIENCNIKEILLEQERIVTKNDDFVVPIKLKTNKIADNYYYNTIESTSGMIVKYYNVEFGKKPTGILSCMEMNNVSIPVQKHLCTVLYNTIPPFEIIEYFDGVFLTIEILNSKLEVDVITSNTKPLKFKNRYKILGSDTDRVFLVSNGMFYHFKPVSVKTVPLNFKICSNNDFHQILLFKSEAIDFTEPGNQVKFLDKPSKINTEHTDELVSKSYFTNYARNNDSFSLLDRFDESFFEYSYSDKIGLYRNQNNTFLKQKKDEEKKNLKTKINVVNDKLIIKVPVNSKDREEEVFKINSNVKVIIENDSVKINEYELQIIDSQ